MKDPKTLLTNFLIANPTVQAAWFDDETARTTLHVIETPNPGVKNLHIPNELAHLTIRRKYQTPIQILRLYGHPITPFNTNQDCQNEPVTLGTQIQPEGASWLGTAGAPISWIDNHQERHWGLLTNWHVAADGDERVGRSIHQPNNAYPPLAHLADWSGPDESRASHIDAAIADARVDGYHTIANQIIGIGPIGPQPIVAAIGLAASKSGRTTGLTHGHCTAVGASVRVGYGDFTALFEDQDIYEATTGAFSAPGDSGSMIVGTDCKCPASLLFAGNDVVTIGNPMRYIVEAFGLVFPFN